MQFNQATRMFAFILITNCILYKYSRSFFSACSKAQHSSFIALYFYLALDYKLLLYQIECLLLLCFIQARLMLNLTLDASTIIIISLQLGLRLISYKASAIIRVIFSLSINCCCAFFYIKLVLFFRNKNIKIAIIKKFRIKIQ